jgi:hypothetical protein
VETDNTPATSTTDETPASKDNLRGAFKVRDFSVLSMPLFYQLAINLYAMLAT